ncbi:hypothetical protein MMPV_000311 [Pyropia vietnamensis]
MGGRDGPIGTLYIALIVTTLGAARRLRRSGTLPPDVVRKVVHVTAGLSPSVVMGLGASRALALGLFGGTLAMNTALYGAYHWAGARRRRRRHASAAAAATAAAAAAAAATNPTRDAAGGAAMGAEPPPSNDGGDDHGDDGDDDHSDGGGGGGRGSGSSDGVSLTRLVATVAAPFTHPGDAPGIVYFAAANLAVLATTYYPTTATATATATSSGSAPFPSPARHRPDIAAAATLALALGDAAAAVVGRAVGRRGSPGSLTRWVLGDKTPAGSAAMATVTAGVVGGCSPPGEGGGAGGVFGGGVVAGGIRAAVVGVAAAAMEAVVGGGADNLAIPAAVAAGMWATD